MKVPRAGVLWLLASLCACAADSTGSHGDANLALQDAGTADELCLEVINQYRATLSLTPYSLWSAQSACVAGEASDDATAMRAHAAFGACGENGQNECPDWPGPASESIPKCLAQMWAEGPGSDFSQHGHYLNMSSTQFSETVCGIYTRPSGAVWITIDFH